VDEKIYSLSLGGRRRQQALGLTQRRRSIGKNKNGAWGREFGLDLLLKVLMGIGDWGLGACEGARSREQRRKGRIALMGE